MKGKKNLERAIILGLILSTGVYGTALAEPIEAVDNENSSEYTSVILDTSIEINDGDNGNIVLDNAAKHTVSITANGEKSNISLKGENTAIWVADDILAGTTVTLKADGDIIIDADNGIQANAKAREDENVSQINLTAKNNKITANKIGIYSTGGVDVLLNAESNEIISKGEYGIQATQSSDGYLTLTATNGDNIVKAENGTAIRANGEKVISLNATGNNIVIGGVYGVQNTQTNELVKNNDKIYTDIDGLNNVIYGGDTAVISDGAGITDINATENNTIGQYTDENKVTHTSNTGINVTEGTVNVTADGSNSIYGNLNGINVNGANSKVSLNSAENVITVNNSAGAKVNGINVDDDGFTEVKSTNGNIEINVETTGTHANAINVGNINGGGEVKLTTINNGDVLINVVTGMPDATNGNVYGIRADKVGKVTIDSANNVVVNTESTVVDNLNGGNDVSAIEAHAAGVIDIDAKQILSVDTKDINSVNYGIRAYEASALVDIDTKGKNEYGYGVLVNSSGKQSHAVYAQDASTEITAEGGGIYISADGIETTDALYLTAINVDSHSILNANGDIVLTAYNDADTYVNTNYVAGVYTNSYNGYKSNAEISGHDIYIKAESENNASYGIYAINASSESGSNKVELYGHNIVINADGYQGISYGILSTNSEVNIVSNANNQISSTGYGVYAWDSYGSDSNITVETTGNNILYGYSSGVVSSGKNALIDIDAIKGTNMIASDGTAIQSNNSAKAYLTANKNNEISASTGVWTQSNGYLNLDAVNNIMDVDEFGIYTATNSKADLIANEANNIYAGNIIVAESERGNLYYGQQSAVYALSGSSVDLAAGEQNYLLGAVYANGSGTNVDVKGKDGSTATNVIRSHAAISNAGDIDTTTEGSEFTGKTFYSALYAEDGANIKLDGNNIIGTWADSGKDAMLERTVWAYNEGTIDITGAAQIRTDRYDSSPNSADVAIAAGTATKLTKDIVDNYDETDNPRATVTVNYDDFKDENGVSISKSNISGDILSAYAGLVDISTDNSEAGINITGNLLAGNNGILSVDLGKGGTLIGRADDYGDAGYVGNIENEGDTNEHQNFYNPAFSSTIYSGGRVDLEMGSGSTWFVTGQSWITSINTEKAQGDTKDTRATIDLTTMYENDEADATTAHALTVYDFKGDADFKMNLSGDRANSDMLYMKHADGTYRINLVDAVTTDEINSDQNGNEFSGLRFATVGSDSNVNFVVGSYDNGGAFNVEYEVGTDEYGGAETAHENNVYNGSSLNSGKPGSDMVNGFFGSDGEPVSSDNNTESGISTMDLQAANNIMLMSEEAATLDETAAAANDATDYNATNHKIIARLGEEISDTGKTILNMSRANYSNAIYMDRLNKRLGEARYINSEEDEGMWVRIRHDRIGKDDAYRSQNTMYELGYDQKQECDNGERRVGMAIDYMHGDTGYDQIAGKGEIDRYGLWLYDTWMGDKGHYADYVAKWGHLSNDFEVYTMQNGDKVTGDYSNNVFSVSAEYGRKKDIGNDWYFEPQVQAQLARVTGADYTTNQGTKVSVDGINSLIGRAGFRLGKDFGEEKQSTVYIKADVLHEFLGDQDVRVLDKSSDNKWAGISYENEGTWYDVGFGFATQMSKNSYAFMDFEKSFGNDNDETYQINVGMQWSF